MILINKTEGRKDKEKEEFLSGMESEMDGVLVLKEKLRAGGLGDLLGPEQGDIGTVCRGFWI